MSTDQFRAFADALSARYSLILTQGPVFTVNAEALWENYLVSFPEGTNPIYRTRTEHDGVWATRDELLQMTPDELRKQLAELDS